MNPNILPSDRATIVGAVDPDALTAGAHSTGWISMADYENLQAIIQAGTLGASATLDAKLEQAQDGAGTGVKDITGKAITQLTQAGGDSDSQAVINLRASELDHNNDFTHARLTITVATATSDGGGLVLAHDARYQPATPAATVAEVVS